MCWVKMRLGHIDEIRNEGPNHDLRQAGLGCAGILSVGSFKFRNWIKISLHTWWGGDEVRRGAITFPPSPGKAKNANTIKQMKNDLISPDRTRV